MLSLVERDGAWVAEPTSISWDEELKTSASAADVLLDKVDDGKLAQDVDDLSAIFEELESGVVDFPLPCDEDQVATGADVAGDWIGDLEKDVVNVDELSAVFDALVSEEELALEEVKDATGASEGNGADAENEAGESGDEDEESQKMSESSRTMIHAAPTWVPSNPIDPRSLIQASIFKNLDSRIPRVPIPRIDLGLGANRWTIKPKTAGSAVHGVQRQLSPKACKDKTKQQQQPEYHHDANTCWICKSSKSPYKKFALHRYLEKRFRRNWKRGPRYSGRSHVATNRVREGGRFVCTAYWV